MRFRAPFLATRFFIEKGLFFWGAMEKAQRGFACPVDDVSADTLSLSFTPSTIQRLANI
jgi:hypothetical protein